jgi:hypothetical protein
VVDIVTPKEEPQVFKIKLPDASHLSMPIYSCGNNKEYLVHIIAVLQVIEQKGLPKKCLVLAKAVARRSSLRTILAFGDCMLVGGFKYALIFVDRATRYNWCFGLKSLHHNDILSAFLAFQSEADRLAKQF